MKLLLLLITLLSASAFAQSPADVITRNFHWIGFRSQLNLERFAPKGATIFIGDSLIQNLDVNSIDPKAVNFGIGGDTSAGVLHRLHQYRSLKSAKAVVLESGINDLGYGEQFDGEISTNYRKMLALISSAAKSYIIAIFPVDESVSAEFSGYNKRIKAINEKLRELCASTKNCAFINLGETLANSAGNLRREFHRDKDAVHYNDAGERVILRELSRRITSHSPA